MISCPVLKAPIALEIFDSHNTSYQTNPYRNSDIRMIHRIARKASIPFKCVIHDVKGQWIEYEKGEITSWSA